ncbi:SUMF1/EgtB/PvdO family nonheme iron enzyme [Azoarcus sp. KH32C]|uniref:formylglycine-generating enzyme family protein n=1 Tax=Azoarcus sp. KH32C TaxID=748247 RepID=UPI0002386AF8|nr:SUMF1/EgtB/PvdO family nonheme iron enzyme [Azoarcus sp. KH32C]BAL22724.1 hypothetical protein AZKH_0378 [Azoarcus sp. KH32C]
MRPFTTPPAALILAGALLGSAAHAASPGTPRIWQDPQVAIEFIHVEKSCYRMGNDRQIPPEVDGGWVRLNYTQSLSHDEGPAHEACLDAYWLGSHEITRKQWLKVMGALPDGDASLPQNLPVARVTWEQANAFTDRLNALYKNRYRFRLPTEAEWEFACRGANPKTLDQGVPTTPEDLALQAVADIHAPRPPEPVGSRNPNTAGFYDLLGNVWEWTADDYAPDAYTKHSLYNPRYKAGLDKAVIRGGSVRTEFMQARCTMRGRYPKQDTLDHIGLRVVREE